MIICDHSLQLSTRECLGKTAKKIHPKAIWDVKMTEKSASLQLCQKCTSAFLFKHLDEVAQINFIGAIDKP